MDYKIRKSMRVRLSRLLEEIGSKLADLGLGKSRVLSSVYYLLKKATMSNKKSWVDFEGYKIYIDPNEYVGKQLYIGRFHENRLRDKILQEVEKGDRVVDIGAHIGSTALVFRSAVGEYGEVICFEPNPESFEMLQTTIERNDFDNFKLFNQALGDSDGAIKMEHNKENTGVSSIRDSKEGDKNFNADLVQTKDKLDSLGEIDWIKIDVEGAEYEILSNLGAHISSFKGLFLELHSGRLSDSNIEEIYELLSKKGVVYTLNGKKVEENEFIEYAKDNGDIIWKNFDTSTV